MTTDPSTTNNNHAPGGLSRAFAWAIITIAGVLRDSLDPNGKDRRRKKTDGDRNRADESGG